MTGTERVRIAVRAIFQDRYPTIADVLTTLECIIASTLVATARQNQETALHYLDAYVHPHSRQRIIGVIHQPTMN